MSLTPEQEARKEIDRKLEQSGWAVQDYTKIDFKAGLESFRKIVNSLK